MSEAVATPTAPPSLKPAGDFPTWLPPMLVKELRQGLRTRGFVIVFIAFQALMALLMMGSLMSQDINQPGARASIANTVNGFFWTLLTVQLLVVTPARALGSLQLEMESRSIDLLLLTRLSAWRIVVGKWGSLVAQAALLLVAMMPYGIVRYFAGSAELVSDAKLCLALLGGCAVLTSAGLWSSGLSKAFRIVFVVAGVFGSQLWRPLMTGSGLGGFGATSAFTTADAMMWITDGALLLLFFLVAAVRRVAPPAENHSPLARALPLIALVTMPIWARHGWNAAVGFQLGFTGAFIALVCAVELANARLPMLVHVRPWAGRGGWARFIGRFVLPGWPSALLFTTVLAGLAAIGTMFALNIPAGSRLLSTWVVTLAFGALAAPTLALAYFKRTATKSGASLYGLTLGAMSVLAATAAFMAATFPLKYAAAVLYARVLPVTGFWLTLPKPQDLSTKAIVMQAILLTVVLAAAAWQTRPFWRHVQALENRQDSADS